MTLEIKESRINGSNEMTLEIGGIKSSSLKGLKNNSDSICCDNKKSCRYKKQAMDLDDFSDKEGDNSHLTVILKNKSTIELCSHTAVEKDDCLMAKIANSVDTSKSNIQSNTFNKENEGTLTSPENTKPKVRLNAFLASDPALQPDAKDLKVFCKETENNNLIDDCTTSTAQKTQLNKSRTTLLFEPTSNVSANADIRMKVFMCLPCGIGFSSLSTLEAHQTFYCSHRKAETDVPSTLPAVSGESTLLNVSENLTSSVKEPSNKNGKLLKQYSCMQCSYSADKKVSLNRHMRMHQTSPIVPNNNINNTLCSGVDELDNGMNQENNRYCTDCDIKFNNVKTYRAHKQHYCSSRKIDGLLTPKIEINNQNILPITLPTTRTTTPQPVGSNSTLETAIENPISYSSQLFLALPTNPILIVPYALLRGASVIPSPLAMAFSGVENPNSTCFALENGQLKPLATTLDIGNRNPYNTTDAFTPQSIENQDGINVEDSTLQKKSYNESLPPTSTIVQENLISLIKNISTNETNIRNSSPLDLSFRRSSISNELLIERASFDSDVLLPLSSLSEVSKRSTPITETDNISPEHIVCAPSIPNSPSTSPSPKRRAISSPQSSDSRSIQSTSPPESIMTRICSANENENILENIPFCFPFFSANNAYKFCNTKMASLLTSKKLDLALKYTTSTTSSEQNQPGLPMNLSSMCNEIPKPDSGSSNALADPSSSENVTGKTTVQPQIYVKQGVSKCKECNIVFCKYENYIAHKLHYCSSRNVSISEEEKNISNTAKPVNPIVSEAAQIAYQQLICAACGIKYTSLDNLRAHQKYYCPKGSETIHNDNTTKKFVSEQTLQKNPCTLSKSIASYSTTAESNIYKCYFCDTVSLTPSENRKHMEIHGTIKAFCCKICHYKGNTFRGIRTHIRMHFDKNTTAVDEEHYIMCLFEDDCIEVPLSTSIKLDPQQATNSGQHQNIYKCKSCNYFSTYRGNLTRHKKLVHRENEDDLEDSSSRTDDEIEIFSGRSANSDQCLQTCIKEEQTDDHIVNLDKQNTPDLLPLDVADNKSNICVSNIQKVLEIKPEPMDVAVCSLSSESTAVVAFKEGETSTLNDPTELILSVDSPNYCQVCDISFKYVNTFIAHKQFYCKSLQRNSEEFGNISVIIEKDSTAENSVEIKKNSNEAFT